MAVAVITQKDFDTCVKTFDLTVDNVVDVERQIRSMNLVTWEEDFKAGNYANINISESDEFLTLMKDTYGLTPKDQIQFKMAIMSDGTDAGDQHIKLTCGKVGARYARIYYKKNIRKNKFTIMLGVYSLEFAEAPANVTHEVKWLYDGLKIETEEKWNITPAQQKQWNDFIGFKTLEAFRKQGKISKLKSLCQENE